MLTLFISQISMYLRLKNYRKMWVAFTITILVLLISFIPARLILAQIHSPTPQAIFTLGGGSNREEFTALFAQQHPTLDIWVSSGAPTQEAKAIFQRAAIAESRIHIDRRAIDTVTNFTSLVSDLGDRHIHHVYLITSDFHMRRARAIAFFVFGSRGITTTPVAIPSKHPNETLWHISRDIGRSILWLITGRTGASLHPQLKASSTSFENEQKAYHRKRPI
ncbi:MAG: YdcF family protein [Leptolyngbyaceae bacterium]|nr:YdcF family protein [Leptolyngbyaceae bacterium]